MTLRREGERLLLQIPLTAAEELTGRPVDSFDLSAELVLYQGFDVRLRSRPLTEGRDPWQNGTATFVSGKLDWDKSPWASVARAERSDLPAHARQWGRAPLAARHDGNVPRVPLALEATPQLATRLNSMIGETQERTYLRGYGCSGTICSSTIDFFRSGTLGMYDLEDDSGMRNFAGVRPGCRITLLPALGVLLSAEGTGDCFCPYNFSTTLAMAPASQRRHEDWALFVDKTRVAQLQNLALNLGAPGDRRDEQGTLWLGYPRQPLMFATGGSFGPRPHAFGLPVRYELFEAGEARRVNADRTAFPGSLHPWMHASGLTGVKKVALSLIYHEPKSTCLASRISAPPRIDGLLDDPSWRGDTGVGVSLAPRATTEKGRVRVRHDDERLYLAYEQQPEIDRKGITAPWTDAYFDVLLKHSSQSAYAWFRVNARGEKSSSAINGVVAAPRLKGIDIDGHEEDWKDQGLSVRLGEDRGAMRLGWQEDGLAICVRLLAGAADKPGPGLRVQLANVEGPALVELVVNAARATAEVVEFSFAGQPAGEDQQEVVDEPDPAKKELESFRSAKGLAAPVVILKRDDHIERLGIQPKAGAALALQISAFDPDAADQNVAGGAGARRSLFRSGHAVSLKLTDDPKPGELTLAAQKREWFGTTLTFAGSELAIPPQAWEAAVAADDHSLRVECSIPWSVLKAAGLEQRHLLAQFRTPGRLPTSLEQLQALVAARHVRLVTEPTPLKPRAYQLRLHFAEIEDRHPGERVFHVKVQGRLVAENLDIVRQAGGLGRPLAKTFRLDPQQDVEIEFLPVAGQPLLNGLELLSEDTN
jgi:hypothetical protein